jgi:alpha-1,2-mannosyltransferase
MCAGFFVLGTHGMITKLAHPTTTDFASFYAAGKQVNAGAAPSVYNPARHYIAEQEATARGIDYVHFFYPPIFLLLCAPLARLPYLLSFAAFELLSLFAALVVLQRILRMPMRRTVLYGLAFPATLWSIGVGQNAVLTVAIFGAATLAIDDRPFLAGLFIGLLAYKPQLGLFFPVALLAQRNGRAFLAATCMTAFLILLSLVAFGSGCWRGFFDIARQAHATYETGAVYLPSLTAPFGALLSLSAPARVAYDVQAVTTVMLAGLVYYVWSRPYRLTLRAAIIAAATPLATPMTMFYDLTLSGLAIACLVRDGYDHGFGPWRRLALLCVFPLPLFSGHISTTRPLIISFMSGAAILALAMSCLRSNEHSAECPGSIPASGSPTT